MYYISASAPVLTLLYQPKRPQRSPSVEKTTPEDASHHAPQTTAAPITASIPPWPQHSTKQKYAVTMKRAPKPRATRHTTVRRPTRSGPTFDPIRRLRALSLSPRCQLISRRQRRRHDARVSRPTRLPRDARGQSMPIRLVAFDVAAWLEGRRHKAGCTAMGSHHSGMVGKWLRGMMKGGIAG